VGARGAEGNRLAYLDEFSDPYYVGRDFPKLTTPQWIGEEGVEAVVVLAIDDMRGHARCESYLRPILERLKKIDGRAPVSIMTCTVDPKHAHLQRWLKEGLSLEVHTIDHPCPLLQGGNFAKAKSTYDRCVDLLSSVPGNRPVAFRMPCCDSQNTPSPRFYAEIFNRTTANGHFLSIDTSVFHVFTSADSTLPRNVVLDRGRERFKKYLPFPSFVNTIENYPYPYVIGKLCWQFPCMVPSDWEAQNLHKPNNPQTIEDMKAALDLTVLKRGTFNLVFHPHGWIRSEQIVDLIDHAVKKHGKKVKFLTFREALERMNKHLLGGHPLRDDQGRDNGVRIVDLNNDGYVDVVIGNDRTRRTRVWSPSEGKWLEGTFPAPIVTTDVHGARHDAGVRFGEERGVLALCRNERTQALWRFVKGPKVKWVPEKQSLAGLELDGRPVLTSARGKDLGVRLRDIDGDGVSELIVANPSQSAVFRYHRGDKKWHRLPYDLPAGATVVDENGRDAGLRFVDVNADGHDDVIFSNQARYSLHLFDSIDKGWSTEVLSAPRGGKEPSIPVVSRLGTNNGAWFHSGHMWVQNEDTARMPDLVDRRSFAQLLAPLPKKAATPSKEKGSQRSEAGAKIDTSRTEGIRPLSPEDALASFRLRTGLQIELVAAEPLIVDPVAFDWGPDGRLWVVEMSDYPSGIDGKGKPGGRIKVLEDRDGDGRYDRSTLFLDGIAFPTGVKVWRKGILVTAAPDIFYAEDTNGDGKADKRKTLYKGFGEGNQQHRVNGLRWGLDNWLYVGNGDSGGKIRSIMTGAVVNVSGRDLRIRPDDGRLDACSGNTQFGISRDDWGNWFGGNNSNPMWHYVLNDSYLRRNPHVTAPNSRVHVSVQPGAAPVFPVSRTLARFNDPTGANRFSSASSPMIYRDELLGGDLVGNSFVCEPVHNLVHREVVAPKGYTFTSRRADDEQKSEFLASTDSWFRPAMVRTGPDGALWIADMYRFVIEHPKWIPQDRQKKLNLRAGDTRGRIYRITPTNRPPRPVPRLDQLPTAGLVAALDSPNGPQRDLAQQVLLWRGDKTAAVQLETMLRTNLRPQARLHALCTLDGLQVLTLSAVLRGLRDPHPGIRRHAVRLSERYSGKSDKLFDALRNLADDEDPQVRMQVAYTLGRWPQRGGPVLGAMLVHSGQDPYLKAALLSSTHKDNIGGAIAGVLQATAGKPPAALLEQLLALATTYRNPAALSRVLESLSENKNQRDAAWQFTVLAGLLDALDRGKQSLSKLRKDDNQIGGSRWQAIEKILQHARRVAVDSEATMVDRLAAIRMLGRDESSLVQDRDLMVALLAPRSPGTLQAAVVQRLTGTNMPNAAKALLAVWQGHGPQLREVIVDSLIRRDDWASALAMAIESGQVPASEISARGRQRLMNHSQSIVRATARKAFAGAASDDRQSVLTKYKSALTAVGNRTAGAAVFKKSCSACHRLDDVGNDVGADLLALTDKSVKTLLTAILDPNRAVEAKFVEYQAVTSRGLTFSGMLADETGAAITLVEANGKRRSIARAELETLRSTGRSLMPEGLEKDLSPQDVADVIAYLATTGPPSKSFPGNKPKQVRAAGDGSLTLRAATAKIYGPKIVFEPKYKNLGWWQSDQDRAVWDIDVTRAGTYEVTIDYACHNSDAGDQFVLSVGNARLTGKVAGTGTWDNYRQTIIGRVELSSGASSVVVRSSGKVRSAMIDLRSVVLKPVLATQ